MSGDRLDPVSPSQSKGAGIDEFIGKAGSYERGFVFTASVIVTGLLLSRAIFGSSSAMGIVVPLLVLGSLYIPRIRRGLETRHPKINTRPRIVATALLLPPYLFRIATEAFSRTEKAAILTSWVATLIGSTALLLA
jgi:hypothetical protein